jgi:hypothetical protein
MSHHLTEILAALGATTGTVAFTAIVILVVIIGRKMPR